MPFNKEDFTEHHEKLRIIAYNTLNLNYFQPFSELSKRQQRQVNKEINDYIKLLPEEGYIEIITDLFNDTAREEIFDKNFHKTAASMVVRKSTKEELSQEDEATQQGVDQHKTTMDNMKTLG